MGNVTVIADDLSVCVDCLLFIANCDVSEERPGIADDIAREWPGVADGSVTLVAGGASDTDDSDGQGFSWHACDGCGSTLGGDRHVATALRNGA